MIFGNVSEINLLDSSSYLNKAFLTFDIDWASDEVLQYCIEIVEQANVKATWFVTHQTPLLQRLRSNPLFELGIHPNFNFLLEGDFRYGKNYQEVLEYYFNIVLEAKVMRSHSLAISSRILISARKLGITHENNLYIPMATTSAGGGGLQPYKDWSGLIRCPYHWDDYIASMNEEKVDIDSLVQESSYLMFGFHPINIFLNTSSLEQYESARSYFQNYEQLKKYQGDSPFGSRKVLNTFLNDLK